MDRTEQRATATRRRIVVALLAGLIVHTVLFPWGGGQDAVEGSACFSMFGWYSVPCGGGVAFAAGAATAAILWLVLWLWNRSRE